MTSGRRSPSAGDRHPNRAGTPVSAGNPNFTHKSAIAPPPLRTGQVRCPVCRNGTMLTPVSAVLRKHDDLFGHPCWNRAVETTATAEPAPPVVVKERLGNALSPTGRCHECGRAVSGERKFCGRCLASRL